VGATGNLGKTGSGLLGGPGSNVAGLLERLPNLGLPSLTNVHSNALNGTPSAPSNVRLPSLPLPAAGGILVAPAHHSR
jgi:hypothetical protein